MWVQCSRYLVERRVHRRRGCDQRPNIRAQPCRNYLMVVRYNNVLLAMREAVEVPRRSLRPSAIPLLTSRHETTEPKRRDGNCMDIQLLAQRLLAGAAFAVISLGAQGAELTGEVVAVSDGDTITVLDADRRQHKVRLQGIDAPEKGQDHWRVSKQHLADRVFAQQVTVEYRKKDRYGRLVGFVSRNGLDINREQLAVGAAWFYRKYAPELPQEMRTDYADAESAARIGKRGLWRNASPVPPWEWRARAREQ